MQVVFGIVVRPERNLDMETGIASYGYSNRRTGPRAPPSLATTKSR